MKIAMLQMPVGFDKEENIRKAASAVRWAAEQGADMAILPEMWNCPYSNKYFPDYAEEGIGPTRQALIDMAKENRLWLVGGSIPEREDGKVYNTSFVYDPEGREVARHRKVHLFDITSRAASAFSNRRPLPPATGSPPSRPPGARWAFASALICASPSLPA